MLCVNDLFDVSKTIAAPLLEKQDAPWTALSQLSDFILQLGKTLEGGYEKRGDDVWIAADATVAASALIIGPCIIDSGAEIRHCAFIRGSVIVGKGAVVGNSVELKNALLFDGVQVPHYNYIGDSILGYKAHFGAGSLTSNVKSDKSLVAIKTPDGPVPTGLKKLGALVGDGVEIGCNAVLCPGTVIGRGTRVYPLCRVRGLVEANCIYKDDGNCVPQR